MSPSLRAGNDSGTRLNIDPAIRGSLFATDFLNDPESIGELSAWKDLDDGALGQIESRLRELFERFSNRQDPNESETEDDLIWPTLEHLGWTAHLRQQNLSGAGRADVPDGLLFADDHAKGRAVELREEHARYAVGAAVVESKRWLRNLDRGSDQAIAPSTQMLRYLRRADDLTEGRMRWGILTNGARWRLYYQGARSVSEGFFEVDVAPVLDLPGHNEGLFALSAEERRHCLKLFVLLFGRKAFLAEDSDRRTLHQRALAESRLHEERVAANISALVFEEVFPGLVRALAEAAPDAALSEVRDAALVLLYRLLFLLYAEDRALLPVGDPLYRNIGLRDRVRLEVGRRKDGGQTFSSIATSYYAALEDLSRTIDRGDPAFGLPPYNGGLFDESRTPLLGQVRLSNHVMANVIDALSFERPAGRRGRYINYRSLSVQQLGSIYERLLEFEPVRDGGAITVRPNLFARRGSGSYYTPEPLVALILNETVGPLADRKLQAFHTAVEEFRGDSNAARTPTPEALEALSRVDPAEALLSLRVCDPAMGSGHFLVSLVDLLSDRVIAALAEAEGAVPGYVSPLVQKIEGIRNTILGNARQSRWTVDPAHLDDRQIVRRMVLKRCVYGVDKNPMAVELAKVSLWLHTFTAGAPLSFLDHHLHCGDSLFGSWVREGLERARMQGGELFLAGPLARARAAADPMQTIEALSDAEVAETARSSSLFAEIAAGTQPLNAFLSLLHAFEWLSPDEQGKAAIATWLLGNLGDPVGIAEGKEKVAGTRDEARTFAALLSDARRLIAEERFLNWQVAFPGVWTKWEDEERQGGFDAVIGNPPWDRIKLQQVEWFGARRREIALAQRASDRRRMIQALEAASDPLSADFRHASDRAATAAKVARQCGDYPLLARGDINLYSLFVERALALVHPDGVVGLLTPSGIASDKTAAPFFRSVATEGRLRALYDFENRRTRFGAQPFFPDVDTRFKFCAFVARRAPSPIPANCAFFLQDVGELADENRRFQLAATDFARVNPNTGTAPIFRSRRDAELTTAIYDRLPVLVDRSSGKPTKAWPVTYATMFHMTNDSHLFRTREELQEQEGAWPVGDNRFDSPAGQWLPLYEGKMVQAFDHRAASVTVHPENPHRPAQAVPANDRQRTDASWLPTPQFWVAANECGPQETWPWRVAFKDVTAPTNVRTMIAALVPVCGAGNTLPLLRPDDGVPSPPATLAALAANFNATIYDYLARQKVQGQHLNWYIVEQIPVVPPSTYGTVKFGHKSAAQVVHEAVLELTYTAHDMASFARDLGYVDTEGEVRPPFRWDEDRRLYLRAKLDAVYFHLYGITNRDDIRYIYSTFPIVERQEVAAYGSFRSRDLCLAWMNALSAGQPDAEVDA